MLTSSSNNGVTEGPAWSWKTKNARYRNSVIHQILKSYIPTFSPAPRACPSGTGDVDKVGTNSSQIDPLHIGAKVPFYSLQMRYGYLPSSSGLLHGQPRNSTYEPTCIVMHAPSELAYFFATSKTHIDGFLRMLYYKKYFCKGKEGITEWLISCLNSLEICTLMFISVYYCAWESKLYSYISPYMIYTSEWKS